MHGEYKTPGGKLVVADFEVKDGKLADVVISGDFFLEPAEALSDISGALEGAPAELGEGGLTRRVRGALDDEVEMIGFSPDAVAKAVRRALE